MRYVPLCLVFLAIAGCQKKQFEWSEDVRLQDGSTVRVERFTRYGKVLSEMGGPTSRWVSEAKVTIVEPGGRRLPVWSHGMMPFVLDKDSTTGRWLIGASAAEYCDYASRFGPPYVTFPMFELKDTQWVYIGFPESMMNRWANLLVGTPKKELGRDPHLTPEDIAASNARLDEWARIDPRIAPICARKHVPKR